MFFIEFSDEATSELKQVPVFYRRQIWDKITEQLTFEPSRETRNKKPIEEISFPVKGDEPPWELRIGEYRVYYDVNAEEKMVFVHAVKHKPPHKTTKEIL